MHQYTPYITVIKMSDRSSSVLNLPMNVRAMSDNLKTITSYFKTRNIAVELSCRTAEGPFQHYSAGF